eukprot:2960800-Amphidinium_carterae.1
MCEACSVSNCLVEDKLLQRLHGVTDAALQSLQAQSSGLLAVMRLMPCILRHVEQLGAQCVRLSSPVLPSSIALLSAFLSGSVVR